MLNLAIEVFRKVNRIFFAVKLIIEHSILTVGLMILEFPKLLLELRDVTKGCCHMINSSGNILIHFFELLHVLFLSNTLDIEHLFAENQ
jgi:hypothetical protein